MAASIKPQDLESIETVPYDHVRDTLRIGVWFFAPALTFSPVQSGSSLNPA